ncbi:MAG: MoaD/ThiS family protein [Smithellaceae bacterium]|jgi:sulfur carrier protein ThiS
MKIKVKLFGQLRKDIPAYQHDKGMELTIPEGSKVTDLMALLKIPNPQAITAIMEGRVLPLEEKLINGSLINIFPVMYGG